MIPAYGAAEIFKRASFVGVTDLARETGFSQGYVSKMLARGYSEDAIRGKAEWAEYKRALKASRNPEQADLHRYGQARQRIWGYRPNK